MRIEVQETAVSSVQFKIEEELRYKYPISGWVSQIVSRVTRKEWSMLRKTYALL